MARSEFPVDDQNEAMFLISMGEKSGQPQDWTGEVIVLGGELETLRGYKFDIDDRVLPPNGWSVKQRQPVSQARETIYFSEGWIGEPSVGVMITLLAQPGCTVEVKTTRGNFSFKPTDFRIGERKTDLEGDAAVVRLPVARKIGSTWWNDDFPSIAADGQGGLWVVWTGYHAEHDELGLRHYKDGKWSNYLPVPGNQGDVWWPQALIDENDNPWVVYAQQDNNNWDLYAVRYDKERNWWSDVEQITDHWMVDSNHQTAMDRQGNLYVTWQGLRGKNYDILLKVRRDGEWSKTYVVSGSEGNEWEPSIALDSTGRAWIVWDSYGNGDYDVFLRSFKDGRFGEEIAVAGTPRLDKRASVVVDKEDRVWIAWEQGDVNWGKDLGFTEKTGGGTALGGRRHLRVAVWNKGLLRVPAQQPDDVAFVGSGSFQPRLFTDGNGNVGILFLRRTHAYKRNAKAWWEQQLTLYQGDQWTTPTPLPLSWNRPDTRGDVVAASDGQLWAAYSTDNRDYPFPHRPVRTEIYAARMPSWPARTPVLVAPQVESVSAAPTHPDEPGDLKAIRSYRTMIHGREVQILRGDTHRHTDMSWDGGGTTDGSFSEFWRYMIDAANLDWGNVSDHQGGGTYMDYYWWLQGKAADMYYMPGRYTSLFGYERGMLYPDGHRNIVAAERSLRVLPFLRKINFGPMRQPSEIPPGGGGHAENDVKYLYKYLHRIKAFCLSHTSGTRMGTDWRDNDPEVEPVVEIFQGARTNYEEIGAPKAVQTLDPKPDEAPGGFRPDGYVNHAWAKGYRLGVVASSDHNSTHISYAMVYTHDRSREGIIDAVKRRHTYGATDNIILDYRMGHHFMGEDFESDQALPIRVYVRGTKNIAAIRLIRGQKVLYSVSPDRQETTLTYLDNNISKGEHYYYIRVEQQDGELA
ncbi:hypothetical protein MYX84_14930, partial [Acidobacteria bacterium AH-259-O06]|nr:hypothetical protein [Acidobacteria bacterium AH-259-O06]